MGYGLDAPTFNGNHDAYSATPNAALAQSGSLTGQGYTPIARVVALIDQNGNVNSATGLFNIFDTNNPRTYVADEMHMWVSGQGNTSNAVDPDNTGGIFFTKLGSNSAAPITGLDTANKENGAPAGQDTRDVQIYNGTLYLSFDSKEGTGFNRSGIGSLGNPPSTTLYNSPPTTPVTSGPTALNGFQKTGKVTITTGTSSNGNNLNNTTVKANGVAQNLINLSPSNFFFAAPNVVYIADTGNSKNDSNGDNAIPSQTNIGDGGLQKWVNSASNGSGTWSLKYTLYQGLNLVNNTNSFGTSGLYGLTGVVNGTTVNLYGTNTTLSDLDQTYLYGITDVLANTTPPGTSLVFTVLATAPVDSNFKGVSFAPATPAGGVTIKSSPSGLGFTSAGTGCAPGTYTTPVTLIWTPGSNCTLAAVTPQGDGSSRDYVFSQWEDRTTSTARAIAAPSSPATYTASFEAITIQVAKTNLVYPGTTNVTVCVIPAMTAPTTGSVQILDRPTVLTTGPLQNNGCANWYITPGLNAGTHSLSAMYSGNGVPPNGEGYLAPGPSGAVIVMVSPTPSYLSASCGNASFAYGGSYSCKVNVGSNAGAAQGNITYSFDGAAPTSFALANGMAQFSLPTPNVGPHNVTISYATQGNFLAAASSTQNFMVTQALTKVQLTPSNYYPSSGSADTLTATVTNTTFAPVPAGSVTFFDNGSPLGAAVTVNAQGQASFTISAIPTAHHSYTAQYGGIADFAAASSNFVSITDY